MSGWMRDAGERTASRGGHGTTRARRRVLAAVALVALVGLGLADPTAGLAAAPVQDCQPASACGYCLAPK